MTDLPPKTRDQLLATIDAVLKEMRDLRATAKVQADHVGIELAESTLLGCRAAVDSAREVEPLFHTLRKVLGGLKASGGGQVAPAVQRTRTTLETLCTALELIG